MSLRILVVGALVTFGAPAALSAQGSGEAERNWAAIAACAANNAADRRHDCIDDVLRRAGVLSSAQVVQEAREEFGRDRRPQAPPPATPAPPPQVAAAPAPAAPVAAAPTRAADMDELVTTIASVRTAGYRRLIVTTAEGSVWEQTQAEAFNVAPKVGDPFSIERAALGSYRCRFGNATRYRCQRAD